MKTFKLIIIFASLAEFLFATEYKGRVVEAGTGTALASVNIYLKNTDIGTTTDESGNFLLKTNRTRGTLVFEHIGYEIIEMSSSAYRQNSLIELLPTVIETQGVQIESEYEPVRIIRDLPQTYRTIKSEAFEIRGYIDAGDLLKMEQSIQIQEEMSGAKKISIRSGNADDVVILYNGIKLNNAYDNTFDLSLINLDQVDQIEVIKGSNSSLYGAEGFSGVVNIIPKTERDYHISFQQRFGSYNSGVWNLQLNLSPLKGLNLSYTQKRGAAQRRYDAKDYQNDFMENDVLHHSANIRYQFGKKSDKNVIDLMYFRTDGDYKSTRHYESLDKSNELMGISYKGDIAFIKRLNFTSAVQNLQTDQFVWLEPDFVDRMADNQSLSMNIDKRFLLTNSEFLIGYQLEQSELDFTDKRHIRGETRAGVESAVMQQQKYGILAIAKFHAPNDSPYLTAMDFDGSYRYDTVNNLISNINMRGESENGDTSPGISFPEDKKWSTATLKFSALMKGVVNDVHMEGFFNSGTNVKFPSLFQQLSQPMPIGADSAFIHPNLSPEKNSSMEVGVKIARRLPHVQNIDSYQFEACYFQNDYTNKFRMYYLQGIPLAFFDNIAVARITGFEVNGRTQLLNDKVSAQLGVSKYNISSKEAFPFKSDLKVVFNLGYTCRNTTLQFHWFLENEQVAWIRDDTGGFYPMTLDAHVNIDLHLSWKINIFRVRSFINATGRNLIKDDTTIEGYAIRDRRYYISLGFQY